ncbi:site-specific integrase [Halorhodospira halochloris]|uniref:tyrosine-type recombinase/integrase n=1 Tax=Halorhodospira halochloris TaxID=1052 RepID=UPI001EE926D7|nr:site-specific integrase [Halorhodospira halochloris]
MASSCSRQRCQCARDAAAFAMLYGGGLRRAEVVALDLSDYESSQARLIVHGKGQTEHSVYLDDGSEGALVEWLYHRGDQQGPLICPVYRGGRIEYRRLTDASLYRAIDRRRKEAKVTPFTPHDLIRSFGGDLLDAGADLATVQRLMGQSPDRRRLRSAR